MAANVSLPPGQRVDKWLWAARFFKTRSMATEAIHGGHVRLNGTPVKPARDLRPGDTLDITAGHQHWTVIVRGLNELRRPASEAQTLYEETEESRTRRETVREAQRLAPSPGSELRGRPTKKARRQIRGFNEQY
ncbi:RNA-binding S4 domain-containing protein [Propionivibrio sp.]|uniref:RNA-binding S4 domain-containing protein n=1 Tax=Propionivibrio sp. TaxID=2212460 RepID=UPI00272ECC80|nr:RNA-binding S4 domain-containing protein [Propionivibrio sp.]